MAAAARTEFVGDYQTRPRRMFIKLITSLGRMADADKLVRFAKLRRKLSGPNRDRKLYKVMKLI